MQNKKPNTPYQTLPTLRYALNRSASAFRSFSLAISSSCFSMPLEKIFWLFWSLNSMVGGSFSLLMRSVRPSLLILPLSATVWRSSSVLVTM
jgi:hypothetical protein